MTNQNHAMSTHDVDASRAVAFDAGLRAYMIRVYNYMTMGVGLTGVVADLPGRGRDRCEWRDSRPDLVRRGHLRRTGRPRADTRNTGAAEFLDLQVHPKAAASAERGTP